MAESMEPNSQHVDCCQPSIPTRKVGIAGKIAIALINFYKFAISPHLAGCCRFEPTCSSYGLQAFQKYSFGKAFKLTAKRLIKCRPGGPHGYDPVP